MHTNQSIIAETGRLMRATEDKESMRFAFLFGVQQALLHAEYGGGHSSPLAILETCVDLKV